MICSFTIYLKPINLGERIFKYKNYDYFSLMLKEILTYEEMKKIVVSNFLTKDRYFEERNYSIKISALDGTILVKLFQFFFLKKMENEKIKIDKTEFFILNIYNNNKYARQLEEEEKFEFQNRDMMKLKILTPMFFKMGNRFITTNEISVIIKNIEKKLKSSSVENFENYLTTLQLREKIKLIEDNSKEIEVDREMRGKIGEILYDISSLDEIEKEKIVFLFKFAFFSGIGYLTEKGYGQVEVI